MEKARLKAFSDGVFAVAITFLALDLGVAGPGHGTLSHQLSNRWRAYAAYAVSFFIIGITWVNHHALIRFSSGSLVYLVASFYIFEQTAAGSAEPDSE
jgi:uncharacterized membrane protein